MSENTNVITEANHRVEFALNTPLTNRTFEQYIDYLGIKKEDLGKTVLDLGSGRTERFARTASLSGIKVFSVNPKLADLEERKLRDEDMSYQDFDGIPVADIGQTSIALAQNLPFPDGTFDSVVSLWAVPLYVPEMDLKMTFNEVMRVLKPKGIGFFGPVRSQKLELEELLEKLKIPHKFTPYNEVINKDYPLEHFTLRIEK